ncbi:hypothetical protein H5410_026584 [Solanum commersonii]|uniref:RING-type E3 ubiquitin transferase n=1 Tax=Solanum commersonii TaxID=4109 RepID=A0A9J5Z138_SOLCO|nr:hypothetical protein H5410_026584 [Solanum commersonii]
MNLYLIKNFNLSKREFYAKNYESTAVILWAESLSWDIFDKDISAFDFPYPLENFKWDGADKILESKDDLIQRILEFVLTLENVTPPFQDDDNICNAKRGPAGSSISGNNFSLEINLIAKHAYTCGDNIIEEYHFNARVFVRTLENFTPPYQDDDTICVNLIFVKKIFVPPEEFALTIMNIIFNYYENIAAIFWNKVCDKIKGYLGEDSSSLYEEFQCLKDFVETIVKETTKWRTYFNEDCEMVLIDSLVEVARREFISLPAVRSIMHYLQKVDFIENELTEECSICMSSYLPGSEAYNMPCNHSFHSGCTETWLLKTPSCLMCRFKLSPTE